MVEVAWNPQQGNPGQYPPPGGPPSYPPPGGYGYGPPAPPGSQSNGMALASLILGIVAIIANVIFIPSILAIIFGSRAMKNIAASGGAMGGAGMAKAGRILGIIGLIITLGVIILFAVAASHSNSNAIGLLR
ncbi:MAG: DUF4190 domain-containing protein [Actinomycetota bacterium]